MNFSLSLIVQKKIEGDFDSSAQTEVVEMLQRYQGKETERVLLNILHLANSNSEKVSLLVDEANMDYRNIIFWAEYPKKSREVNL